MKQERTGEESGPRAFAIACRGNGLSKGTTATYLRWAGRYRRYSAECGLDAAAQLSYSTAQQCAEWYAHSVEQRLTPAMKASVRSALFAYHTFLRTGGAPVPLWSMHSQKAEEVDPLVGEFLSHRKAHRGVSPASVHKDAKTIDGFLTWLRARETPVEDLSLCDIDAYLMYLQPRYARTTIADHCSSVRAFLRFLHLTARLNRDLASSVIGPLIRAHERPPRALPWEDVRRIVRAIDRTTDSGRRDYAMLLMMAVYGLGAGEIIGLRLGDVDWLHQKFLVVRPKTHMSITLPLLPSVAKALADYLCKSRSSLCQSPAVFVTTRNPYRALAASSAIRHRIIEHAAHAGVHASYLGSHVFRHSHATRQMELGAPPKTVSDILGHRRPDSTSVYVRTATERLRCIALPVPR